MTRVFDGVFARLPARTVVHREEVERLVRFFIIGGLSFLLNAGLYTFISRVLWTNGNRSLENFLATSVTSVLNYLAHRGWTFQSQGAHVRQATRYVIVALSAIGLQSGLFWIGYHLLGWHDLLVIFIVAVLIPFYTYLVHKFFTFRLPHVLP